MSHRNSHNDESEKMDNWKQFQGTDLGSLMGSIYGNENKPKINYPKPRARAKAPPPSEPFLPGGAKAGANDPRKSTKVDKKVIAPTVGRGSGGRTYAKVDFIPHRRSESSSKAEIDDIVLRQQHFRPAHIRAVSTEEEKDKYSQICTFKGGKGLPSEMTHPQGEAPFERAEKKKAAEGMKQARERHAVRRGGGGGGSGAVVVQRAAPVLSHQEDLASQIAAEIQERCDHLEHMASMGVGGGAPEVAVVRKEISKRVAELKVLERGI